MLGEAISSLPLRLSVIQLTIRSGYEHQALRDPAVAPLPQRAADARIQGPRPPRHLAAARVVAGAPANPRIPRRHGAGNEARRSARPGFDADLTRSGGAAARTAALPERPRPAREGRGGRALGRPGAAGRPAPDRPLALRAPP